MLKPINPNCKDYYAGTNEKPSNFLQRLRNLASKQCTDAVLRTLFLEQLQNNVRGIIAISKITDLSKLALQADKIIEMSKASISQIKCAKTSSVEKTTTPSELKVIQCKVTITKELNELCET